MFQISVCLLLFLLAGANASATYLARVSDEWQVFKASAEPGGASGAWRFPGYSDTNNWFSAPAGFSIQNGYYTEATVIDDYGFGYPTLYFRKAFTLAETNAIKWLTLRVDYNDGFVAFLNGTEVARRNMPAGPVGFSSVASGPHNRGKPEEVDITPSKALLRTGENIIAIQLHGTGQGDLVFSLTPELLADFTRGPVLQNASSNQVQIIWRTPFPGNSIVDFGTNASLGRSITNSESVLEHAPILTGLQPDTVYYYRARTTAGADTASSPVETFRTFRTSGKVSFVVAGDLGQGGVPQYRVAAMMKKLAPDFVLELGDIIYPYFDAALAEIRHFSVYGPHMKTTPYFYAIGNHDSYYNNVDYVNTFYLPTNNAAGDEHYFSFDAGDAHFASLNSDLQAGAQYGPGSTQYNWLENDLATTKKPWKFLFFHHTIRTSSLHQGDDYDFNGELDMAQLQRSFGALAKKYGVTMIITGHDHVYEKLNPVNGVYGAVSGGGGGGLYFLSRLHPDDSQFWLRHHCCKVTIDGPKMTFEAYDSTGPLFDSFTVYKSVSTNLIAAKWATPLIETQPGDDDDGNIKGQTFNFSGEPIGTISGGFSNLGQVYVANDQTNFYVGFEQLMIGPDQNVFLFIESPGLRGVTNLLAVGNGVVDPDGQGADGLDFLANLSFTNFAPGIGCILGDEFGDAQYRFFERPSLGLNIGQGVYALDAAISDVPGCLIQQFNRSPQTGVVAGEQNANFIELAIPFTRLGAVRPGDKIKVGAVVGRGGFNTNRTDQSRELDSSYLGARLIGAGMGAVRLEGLEVQLAEDPDRFNARLSIHATALNQRRLTWTSLPDKQYVLQSSANAQGGYEDVPSPKFPMRAGPNEFTLSFDDILSSPTPRQRYYRIKILP